MEEKNNLTNNDFLTSRTTIKKNILTDKNNKKPDIKKYNSKQNTISNKKLEQNKMTPINDSKRKQKQIKQCFLDITNTKEKKEKEIQNEEIKPFNEKEKENEEKQNISKDGNKSELKTNKYTKNIKVNKIKIEKINLENAIKTNSNTNRDFYKRPIDNNKNINLNLEQPNIINKYISDFYNSKKSKILLSVKDFNKTNFDKDSLTNNDFLNSDYNNINLINQFNKNNLQYENSYRYSNFSSNTYNNNAIEINQVPYNSSKISFKDIKSFYAHLEIFISLYLKRILKYFIEKIKKYEKPKINININQIQRDGTDMNNYRPIVNVNNAHCSLYCSINLNQDKLFNSLFDNRNIYNIENNTFTPLIKSNEIKNIKQFNKDGINNNNKRNRLLFVSPEYDTTLNNNKNTDEIYYKSVYIPKKKISKSNTNLISGIKINNNNNKNQNFNNKNMKSSPIKEMNINLKQINVCRLNDLNQLYLSQNQNLYKNNSNNFNFSEISPVINISTNNLTNHVKYNSNNIFSNNNTSNIANNNNEKPKLKKIQSTKNGIYMKPKDENKKKKIKEIKIQNKLTPLKKDIDNSKKENNIKSVNILNTYNSFNRNKNENNTSRVYEKLYTINDEKEVNPIKKIYIKRGSKQKNSNNINIKENLFDTYRNQFYSTFLNFKPNKNNNGNDEILVKQIATQDKKVFICIRYINYMKNNYNKKNKNNILNYLNLKISHENSVSIINNSITIDLDWNKEIYEKMILSRFKNNLKLQDIYSFDNDKKVNNNSNIQSKNISFTFKDNSRLKEESQIIDLNLYNFIFILKNAIIKNIRQNFFIQYKKIKLFKKILNNKKNKIINLFFLKFKKNTNINKQIKIDKNNCGVYHKINYNDDFNCTKKVKANPMCKNKAYNLSSHNPINQFNSKNKINNKKNLKLFSSDKSYKKTNKYMNKEINIFVHNNKTSTKNNDINSNNIALNKLKNKFFLMRIKLIKNALKIIKNAL